MNKVDVVQAGKGFTGRAGAPGGRSTHAPYWPEQYVRVQLRAGVTVDDKAAEWTQTQGLLHWMDECGKAHMSGCWR